MIGCGPFVFAQLLVDALNRIVENAIASSVCIGRPFPSAGHGLDGENERHLFPLGGRDSFHLPPPREVHHERLLHNRQVGLES